MTLADLCTALLERDSVIHSFGSSTCGKRSLTISVVDRIASGLPEFTKDQLIELAESNRDYIEKCLRKWQRKGRLHLVREEASVAGRRRKVWRLG